MKFYHDTGISLLTLIVSSGTLICCVLPIIFVTLGLGGAIALLTSQFPILVTLSQYQIWLVSISAVLLAFTAWLLWRPSRSCPTDPKLAAFCNKMQRWNKRIFWTAFSIWVIGTTVTYIVLPIWTHLEGA